MCTLVRQAKHAEAPASFTDAPPHCPFGVKSEPLMSLLCRADDKEGRQKSLPAKATGEPPAMS